MNESQELQKRIDVLYRNHYIWLLQCAKNITKHPLEAEDLIGDLMIYLIEKGSKKIFYKDSLNLLYCLRFLQTRWLNKITKYSRLKIKGIPDKFDIEDDIYPIENDDRIMEAFRVIQNEIDRMSKGKDWAKVRLFNLYYQNDDTMQEVANKIGICKSTMFMNVKKVREHLKTVCENPFVDAE